MDTQQTISHEQLAANIAHVRSNIAEAAQQAGRTPNEITLVAVSKTMPIELVRMAYNLEALGSHGVTNFGENRVQEALPKIAAFHPSDVRWHMIGHLQRNKIKAVLDAGVEVVHSVDSLRLAEELNARAERMDKRLAVMIQVNCSREPQKFGVAVGAATFLAEMITSLQHLRLTGLMTMGPLSDTPEAARPAFARLRELMDDMHRDRIGGPDLRHLSMGMSQDYPIAIEEGATILRIGSALFES